MSLSDPTQTANHFRVELDIEPGIVTFADDGVTVSTRDGRLVVSADVAGTVGGSRNVRIRYSLVAGDAAALLKTMNNAGELAKEPYKALDDALKQLQKSLRKERTVGSGLRIAAACGC